MKRLTLVILSVILSVAQCSWELQCVLAQQPSNVGNKSIPATAPSNPPNQTDSKPKDLQVIPLTIEQSGNSAGERVKEFSGRKDVLKSSTKPGTQFSTSVEVELPKDILSNGPAQSWYLSLSVYPPTKGIANLVVREKRQTDLFLFRGDINQSDLVSHAIVKQKDGWIDLRFLLRFPDPDTKSIVLELTGDPNTTAEVFSLRPFEQVQEESSRQFHNIRFAEDNKTLLFESKGKPEISGK